MIVVEVIMEWIHILCAVLFLGAMFVGTFVLLPTLKAHVDFENRRKFIIHFIPRVRSIMRVVIGLLIVSGIARILIHQISGGGSAGTAATVVFVLHFVFAAVPLAIFAAAPKVLGRKSKEGLCCDPDADDPPILGVMTSTGATLHYIAISAGWLAVLCAVILRNIH